MIQTELIEQTRNLYFQGLNDCEIGKIINKSPDTVALYRKKLNLPSHRWKNSLDKQDLILKDLKLGKTMYSISKEHKCSQSFVFNLAKKFNITVQTREEFINKVKKITFNPFSDLSDPITQYWLGFLSADGAIYENRITLSLKEEDLNHIVKFKNFTNSDLSIRKLIKDNKYVSYSTSFRCKESANTLKELGITSNKTHTLKYNGDFTVDFIRGVVDGDGYIRKSHTEISICTASKDFVNQLLESFKILFQVNTTLRFIESRNFYTVGVYGKNQVTKVLQILYNNACIF